MKLCPHCRSRFALPELHVPPEKATPDLVVGQRVAARRISGVCQPGERGVVVGVSRLNQRPSWNILFERRGIDGFSPCEAGLWLEAGTVCPELVDYTYRDRAQLWRDFDAGRFDAALASARPSGGMEKFTVVHESQGRLTVGGEYAARQDAVAASRALGRTPNAIIDAEGFVVGNAFMPMDLEHVDDVLARYGQAGLEGNESKRGG